MNIEEIKVKLEELPEFVINKIVTILQEYDVEFNQAETIKFDKCPKCGKVHPHIIKGGKTKGGKQMYRCKDCNARFTSDYGFITFGSAISKEGWTEAIKSTLEGDSLTFMAKRCRVSRLSAFYMRHKIMMHLETVESSVIIKDAAELDEKYVQKSHKGKHIDGVVPRDRGERASKRGLSKEKVCILTALDRKRNSFVRAYNMGKPSSLDVMNLSSHLDKETFLWTDGLASYNDLAISLGSQKKELKTHKEYDKVNHLNTVNSFHSAIEGWYSYMRGVASKYINRYCALFSIRWLIKGISDSEALLKVRAIIKATNIEYLTNSYISTNGLFDSPDLLWSV